MASSRLGSPLARVYSSTHGPHHGLHSVVANLLHALIRREADAEDGPHDLAEADDLLHAASQRVDRYGEAHTAVRPGRAVNRCIDACTNPTGLCEWALDVATKATVRS